jgi:hypothetical protein
MMNSDDHRMEELLKRYRPKGPSPALEQRVLSGARAGRRRTRAGWPLGVAAAVALVAGLGVVLWWQRGSDSVAVDESPLVRVEFNIQRAGEAAQLLASAEILAGQPGAERLARKAYARVVSSYADSPFAQEAENRLLSLDERSVER